ncbi:MAG: DNA-binding domain-containing protein [Gammaproteobacteria bacterium]
MSPDTVASQAGFQEVQARFAAYIRDPDANPVPDGIEARRMNLYAELFYNGFDSHLSLNFPVIRKITSDERWSALVRDFMRTHRCQTPLFMEIAQEFIAYLRDERNDPSDPPFLLELAYYEWAELALYVADEDKEPGAIDPNGDLMEGHPVVSDLAWPMAFHFDVHHIGPDYQPAEPPGQPSYLVVHRQRDDQIGFMELNPVTYRLLELLDSETSLTGTEAALRISEELGHPNPEVVVQGAAQTLNELRAREILLGTAR